jgi:hypothetical protein
LKRTAEIFAANRNLRHCRNVNTPDSCLTPVHRKKRNGSVSPGEDWILQFWVAVLDIASTESKHTKNLKNCS